MGGGNEEGGVGTEVERVTGTPATPYEDALAWTLADREA